MLKCLEFMSNSDRGLQSLFDQQQGLITRQQVVEAGLHPRVLSQWVETGQAERVQRGVYRATEGAGFSHEGLLEVQLRLPSAIICLASALSFHGLSTYQPPEVYLAIPRNRADPKLEYPPTRVFYYPAAMYHYGIEVHPTPAGMLRVYGVEKTLADLLRYGSKVGMDLFYEGLKTYIRRTKNKPNTAGLLEAAKVCRVYPKMREALELLLFSVEY